MDMQKLTQKSQEALQQAQGKAVEFGHQQVGTEHLLLALLEGQDGLVPRLLQRMDVPPDRLAQSIEAELRKKPRLSGPGYQPDKIMIDQDLAAVLTAAEKQAGKMRDEYVSVDGAARDYGVVLIGSLDDLTLAVDLEATEALRADRRPT